MKRFENYDEIKELYDKQKHDIYYKSGNITYEVRHIGSTIYCHDVVHNYGVGAIHNFDINGFYAVEKPEPVEVIDNDVQNEDK